MSLLLLRQLDCIQELKRIEMGTQQIFSNVHCINKAENSVKCKLHTINTKLKHRNSDIQEHIFSHIYIKHLPELFHLKTTSQNTELCTSS